MSDKENTTPNAINEPKTRGRKSIPKADRRIGRYINCPNCSEAFYYDYRNKSFQVEKEQKRKIKSNIEHARGDLLPNLQSDQD